MSTNANDDLTSLRLPELQQRFKEATGETSRSPNRKFLIRRIREAQGSGAGAAAEPKRTESKRGAKRATPPPARPKTGRMMVLPVRLEASVVRRLDAAYRRHGIKSRMDLFRTALGAFLAHLGEHDVAALLAIEAS